MFESIKQREEDMQKLYEVLPERDKDFLSGFDEAIETLRNEREYILECVADEEIEAIRKIIEDVADATIDVILASLVTNRKECEIAFIDNNPYCIDEEGNVVKEDE